MMVFLVVVVVVLVVEIVVVVVEVVLKVVVVVIFVVVEMNLKEHIEHLEAELDKRMDIIEEEANGKGWCFWW